MICHDAEHRNDRTPAYANDGLRGRLLRAGRLYHGSARVCRAQRDACKRIACKYLVFYVPVHLAAGDCHLWGAASLAAVIPAVVLKLFHRGSIVEQLRVSE